MINKELLKKNLEYIAQVKPKFLKEIVDKLPEIEQNVSVLQNNGKTHINYKGEIIEDIEERAKIKAENIPKYTGGIDVGYMLGISDEDKQLIENHYKDINSVIKYTNVLIILGTLPFLHIEKILEKEVFENLKEIVIYEPKQEFLFIFLSLTDLKKIADKYKIRIVFLPENEFEDYTRSLYVAYPFVAYFLSYEDENIKEKKHILLETLKRSLITIPYKHALYRIKFSKENIKLPENKYLLQFQTVKEIKKVAKDTPILIVGAGPSLDESIDYIKEIKDKVIIVSLTSAIEKLVNSSIIPDYISIVDTQNNMIRYTKNINKDLLKSIYCLSHLGVETKFVRQFKENLVFDFGAFLPVLNVKPLVKVHIEGGATVLNPTFNLFSELGFSKFILFGVDLGTKYKDKIHYKGFADEKIEKEILKQFFIETEGNFGGKVYQTNDFYISGLLFEDEIRKNKSKNKDFVVYNASDGVKILGTTTIRPEKVNQILTKNIEKDNIHSLINANFALLKNLEIRPDIMNYVKTNTNKDIKKLINYQKQTFKKDLEIFIKNIESLIINAVFKEKDLFNLFFANEAYKRILTNYKVMKLKKDKTSDKELTIYAKKIISDLEKIYILIKEFVKN